MGRINNRSIIAVLLSVVVFISVGCQFGTSPLFQAVKDSVIESRQAPEITVYQAATEYSSWGSAYAFPAPVLIGQSSTPVVFTVANEGDGALDISDIVLADTSNFSITPGTVPTTIQAGDSDSFSLVFNPTVSGTINSTVTVQCSDSDEGSFVLNISGEGLTPLPEISVLQSVTNYTNGGTAYDFGDLPNTVTGDPVTFTIKNEGSEYLIVTGISITDSNNFELNPPTTPFSLAPTATETFTVSFSPDGIDSFAASVEIVSNDPDESTFALNIAGTGTVRNTISVNSTLPINGASDVRIDTSIDIVFDRDIDPATITGTTIKKDTTSYSYTSSWNSVSNTLTLTPNSDLPTQSLISVSLPVTITGFNYELFAGYSFSFTTGTAWHDGNTVFVSTAGSAGGLGTKALPLLSIQDGVDLAKLKGYTQVYVRAGNYTYSGGGIDTTGTAGVHITAPVSLIGGWDSAFTTYSGGHSVLDAESSCDHVLWIDSSDVNIRYLTLTGGYSDGSGLHDRGAGVLLASSGSPISNIELRDLDVQYNTSPSFGGGGVYASGSATDILMIASWVQYNTASINGAGGIQTSSPNTTYWGVYVWNNSGTYGGMAAYWSDDLTILGCSFQHNQGSQADAIYLYEGDTITIESNFIAAYQGVGLRMDDSSYWADDHITNLTITDNNFHSTGGTYSNVVAIKEGPSSSNQDVTGHTITNNSFNANFIGYLYQDYDGTQILADAPGMDTLNTANDSAHDAAVTSGNYLNYP